MHALKRALFVLMTAVLFFPHVSHAERPAQCASVHEDTIAVFIRPTDAELEAMRRENGEEDVYTIADDALYYQWEAVEFLKERDVPCCFTREERHEFLVEKSGEKYVMDRECPSWCLILWNGRGEPVWVSTADIFIYEKYLTGRENAEEFRRDPRPAGAVR